MGDPRRLTEAELEIMNIVWELGQCTIKDIHTQLLMQKDVAYTTVATLVKILEQKNVLGLKRGEKAHHYFPQLSRDEYQLITLEHLKTNVFKNDPSMLVMQLLNHTDLSNDELKSIRSLLNQKLNSGSRSK